MHLVRIEESIIVILLAILSFISSNGFASGFDPEAPEYQCRIDEFDGQKIREGICSGTYITAQIFISAAHCFDVLDTGPAPQNPKYRIKCPHREPKAVLAIAPHPYYYSNSNFNFGPSMIGKINPKFGEPSTISYNDIAILLTEETGLTRFPVLPDPGSKFNYAPNSCRLLGYSDYYCSQDGTGCFRKGFSLFIDPTKEKEEIFCNLHSGEGCYLHSRFQETTSADQPLLVTSDGPTYKGDSGGGVICKNQAGEDVLAGINVKMTDPNTVNVSNKRGFINHFKLLSADRFIQSSWTFELDENMKVVLIKRARINLFLSQIELNRGGHVNIGKGKGAYAPLFIALDDFAQSNPQALLNLLIEARVAYLQPAADSEQTWGWGFWKSNVNVLEGYAGKAIQFNAKASLGEIIAAISQK